MTLADIDGDGIRPRRCRGNGDGHLDLVNGNIGEANAVYLDDGTCRFDYPLSIGRSDGRTYALELTDLDRDGYPEIVTASSDGPNVVYRNVSAPE